jgi:hypothetical protein
MRALLFLALMTTPAFAETPCLPSLDDYAAALADQYGEQPQIIGTMQGGAAFLMFANPETGSWTVIVQAPDGRYCSPASGENYIAAKQGDPA